MPRESAAYKVCACASLTQDMAKPTVLVLGATGETGKAILDAFLVDGGFDVEALVRPSSAKKPQVQALGVPIRAASLDAPIPTLVEVLSGVDILISAIDGMHTLQQIPLATAAKTAGVKRFIPSAFITVAPVSSPVDGTIMRMRDIKEQVYTHIRSIYLPYTVIDVGYWYQLYIPAIPSGRAEYAAMIRNRTQIHVGGAARNALVDLRDIASTVVRIVKDDRTINKSVHVYGDVLSENETFAMMEELSGEKIDRRHISAEHIATTRAKFAAAIASNPDDLHTQQMSYGPDYHFSMHVRSDNTPENAAYLGYLDAGTLYPEWKPITFRDYLREVLDGKATKPYGEWALTIGKNLDEY
ncbi:Glycoside hydrolase [Mycena indigotica]|uniref:Glycoside hydrolase n=1 Tax=Mycena indigotica TaxID=2126181 RepID=A0A8H6W825_9AGAR|nr:Glycoside hydrolase [Mycena indigotica]KAF7309254.1 Glycoside hydrolase [Mycena indigotica]